ncbi:bifunctional adenosylcobinamide kinase/adenosylcobinamide-phosphate guanylyltransferase [Oceanobacillus sp. CF4.6]|uniref:bifunctional adenosylcobinamide kinase/adenosylcobinamide-phosphate guanylyltransferase n=1 Tax=Oceanobacillus sp. CF4.6 TaxID=3373080 RepID=UPI003EE641A5
METASITFITGGVRSGKSNFAEKIAVQRAFEIGGSLHYIATGMPSDREMEKRILKHQKDRRVSGFHWQTWEQPMNIEWLASCFKEKDIILLDCLTILLTNELFSNQEDWSASYLKEVFRRILTGIKAIEKSCHQLIIVSNEVLFDPFHEKKLVFTYCQLIGRLHQEIVNIADQSYVVEAGIPMLMKGDQP